MDGFWAAQAVGFAGLAVIAAAFQLRRRPAILTANIVSALLFTLHFMLLGAATGAAINFTSALRSIGFYWFDGEKRRRSRWLLAFILAAFSAAAVLTWQGWISVLPLAAMWCGTVAFWQLKPQKMRVFSLLSPPLWIIYNLHAGSVAGIITELFITASILTGLWRYRTRPAADRSRDLLEGQ